MAVNLNRGKPKKYSSSNRIGSLIGNGLLTFIDYKKKFNHFFKNSEIVFYHNKNDYHLGDEYNATLYSAFVLNDWLSFSGRFNGKWVRKISGAHAHHTNMLMSPAFSKDQGHRKINFSGGLNFIIPKGELKGQRLAIEYSAPIYQYYDGLQMKSDKMITFGWQYAFNLKDLIK